MAANATLDLAAQLIACPSVTPADAGCQLLVAKRLQAMGFVCETITSGPSQHCVTNLWAKRTVARVEHALAAPNCVAKSTPPPPPSPLKTLVFAGHTDVVPPGALGEWDSAPFTPSVRAGKLFGRGASDMKVSIAAFVVALEEFLTQNPDPDLHLAVLLTSDEEGPATDGTVAVCKVLQARGEVLDYCLVGEPTSVKRTGDMVKNGRRGTMGGRLTIKGVQGHIAYPHLAKNPIHLVTPALAELVSMPWDQGNAHFPPTTWQISNIYGGTGAANVIPSAVVIDFNFRFSSESTPGSLQQRLTRVLEKYELQYELAWTVGGLPFLTEPGELLTAVQAAILAETGITTQLSTSGGTSDGRFLSKICPQVMEFGPPNASIHQINEHVRLSDIEPLKNIYRRTLELLQSTPSTPAQPST